MKKLLFFAMTGLLLSTTGCIKNAGPNISENRDVDNFTSIELLSSADVYITQSNDYEVRVQAGENHIKYIETTVDNGVLTIDESRNRVWIDENVKIWISATFLENVTISGSGDVEGGGFTTDDLEILIEGSGDIDLSFDNVATSVDATIEGSGDIEIDGETQDLFLSIIGSGDFDGRQLYAENVDVNIDGSGDASVWADVSLTINIAGSGDVHYWGDPSSVNTTVSGSGDIVKH